MVQTIEREPTVTISKTLWEEVKKNSAFTELLEDLEDAQDIMKAKSSAKEFFDFDEYVRERREKEDV